MANALDSVVHNLTGKTLGRYLVLRYIGRGGMGVVYEAFDPTLQRKLAIKILLPELVHSPGFVQRFEREAMTAAGLKHANIVTIHEIGEHEGLHYIAMEYVEGLTLKEVIKTRGRLSPDAAIPIVAQVADALSYAFEQSKVIHRDVKPDNIIVDARGKVTLTDFGLAKALESETDVTSAHGGHVGTPRYMSPEHVKGEDLDQRSDIYSLGVVLYEMVTGRTPFQGKTTTSLLHAHVYEPPPPPRQFAPDLPKGVESVLLRALAKAPEKRFATARDMARALGEGKAAPASGGGGRTVVPWIAAGLILLGLIGLVALVWLRSGDESGSGLASLIADATSTADTPQAAATGRAATTGRATSTRMPTSTVAPSDTPTRTATASATSSGTPTPTATTTPSASATRTPTATASVTWTATPTATDTATYTATPDVAATEDAINRLVAARLEETRSAGRTATARAVETQDRAGTQTAAAGVARTRSVEQTADARAVETQNRAGTQTAAAVRPTSTVRPTATLIASRTPSATPAPVPTDAALYDDFNDPQYDGTVDPERWATGLGSFVQGGGMLAVSNRVSSYKQPAFLSAARYQSFRIEQPMFFEGKLMSLNNRRGHVALVLGTELTSVGSWWTDCILGYDSEGKAQPSCDLCSNLNECAYSAEAALVDSGTAHRFRIEAYPNDMKFRYYMDGREIGAYAPDNPEELRDADFWFAVGLSGEELATGYIDDVRVGFIEGLDVPTPRTGIATRISTAPADADLKVYDNFDDAVYDFGYDAARWRAESWSDRGRDGDHEAIQQDGVMILKRSGIPTSVSALRANRPTEEFVLDQPTFFEAKLMSRSNPDSHVFMVLHPTFAFPNDQWADCALGYTSDTEAWSGCSYNYSSLPSMRYESDTESVAIGSWHTFRIEVEPDAMLFRYYLDGKQIGAYTPENREALRKGKFYFQVGVYGSSESESTGYVDDVRIGPIESLNDTGAPIGAATHTARPDAVVRTSRLRLWVAPDVRESTNGEYDEGTPLRVVAMSGDRRWLRVETADGHVGWMLSDYLQVNVSLAGLAVVTPALRPTMTPTATPCLNDAVFVADVSVPDYTVFRPADPIEKTWRVKNTGTCIWGQGEKLIFLSGDRLDGIGPKIRAVTPPGGTIDISVPMTAPARSGLYSGAWQMAEANDRVFGHRLTVVLRVSLTKTPGSISLPTSTPTCTPTPTSTPAIRGVPVFEDLFEQDKLGWLGRNGVDGIADGKLHLSSPLNLDSGEWLGALGSPSRSFEVDGDATIQTVFDRRVRFSGIYFNIPEGYFAIIITQGERATWKRNGAGLGLLRPDLKDRPWDNLGDIEGLVKAAGGRISLRLEFTDQTLTVFVNGRQIARRTNPMFGERKRFGGFYVANGDDFGVEDLRFWASSQEAFTLR